MVGTRIGHMLIAVGPFATMLMVAYGVRGIVRGFPVPESTRVSHQRIAAYVEPMRELEAINFAGPRATDAQVRAVADGWIRRHRNGRLLDMPASTVFDSAREGVRKQVLDAKALMISRLIGLAERGGPMAGEDLGRAFRLLWIARDSDFVSMSQSVGAELRAFRVLEQLGPRLAPDQRRVVSGALEDCAHELGTLSRLFRQCRALVKEYRLSYAPEAEAVEDLACLDRFALLLRLPGNERQLQEIQSDVGGVEANLIISMNLARHCYAQEEMLEAGRLRAIASLSAQDQAQQAVAAHHDRELRVAHASAGRVANMAGQRPTGARG